MAVNATDYQEFDNRHAAISKLMGEISSQIDSASKSFSQGMADAQGRWANADMEDWALLNQQIKVEMETMENLMRGAKTSTARIQENENKHTGFTYQA